MSAEQMMPGGEKQRGSSLDKLLSKPYPQGEIRITSPEDEARFIVLTNGLQARLAHKMSADFIEWKKQYSETFRDAFHETVGNDPLFFDGYQSVADIPEDKIEEIESKLYKLAA